MIPYISNLISQTTVYDLIPMPVCMDLQLTRIVLWIILYMNTAYGETSIWDIIWWYILNYSACLLCTALIIFINIFIWLHFCISLNMQKYLESIDFIFSWWTRSKKKRFITRIEKRHHPSDRGKLYRSQSCNQCS